MFWQAKICLYVYRDILDIMTARFEAPRINRRNIKSSRRNRRVTAHLVIYLAKHYIDYTFCALFLSRSFVRFTAQTPIHAHERGDGDHDDTHVFHS